MNAIGKLAGQTAIYGLSSVLGRVLNFLLVPLYARLFLPEEAAVYVEMYAYVAFFNIILTYGMETAFFRYSEIADDKNKVYSTTLISILSTSALFIVGMLFYSQQIANLIKYPEHPEYIIYFIFIVAIDAINAIPFAKLRADNKAMRFALIKTTNIAINIGSNLLLLLVIPYLYNIVDSVATKQFLSNFTDGTPQVAYIFVSNLIASFVTTLLLIPEIFKIKFKLDFALLKSMLAYAFPLLIFGLAGIVNETIDRVLLKYLLPSETAMHDLGIYGMCYKISIFITIFIQAFRYAAEPFFFSQHKESNAKEVYAIVMHYFIIVCLFMFLGIMLYMDIVKHFVSAKYFSGLHIVPILLFANIFLGIFYNLSIWYKLTGHTRFGAYLSLIGAGITIALNIVLIPLLGYLGAAWTTLICYFAMMVLSYMIGEKYYPVPYNIKGAIFYSCIALAFYGFAKLMNYFHQMHDFVQFLPINYQILKFAVHTILILTFFVIILKKETELTNMIKSALIKFRSKKA